MRRMINGMVTTACFAFWPITFLVFKWRDDDPPLQNTRSASLVVWGCVLGVVALCGILYTGCLHYLIFHTKVLIPFPFWFAGFTTLYVLSGIFTAFMFFFEPAMQDQGFEDDYSFA